MDQDQQDSDEEFQRFFDELTDLLQFAVENIDKPITGEVPEDLEKKLAQLEEDVKLFCTTNEQLLAKSSGENGSAAAKTQLTKAEKRSLERSKKLIELGQQKIEEQKKQQAEEAAEGDIKSHEGSKPRKRKFRSLGGKKDWKPL